MKTEELKESGYYWARIEGGPKVYATVGITNGNSRSVAWSEPLYTNKWLLVRVTGTQPFLKADIQHPDSRIANLNSRFDEWIKIEEPE